MQEVIRIEQAVVSYREDVALNGVSLSVTRGELVGIVGPNGAGKTTLLTVINGLGRLIKGRASVLGLTWQRRYPAALRRHIGYVPQLLHIDPRLPVLAREVVLMGCYGRLGLLRRPGRAEHELAHRLLQEVGMTNLANRPIGHLSGGEQQRIAIARALIQQPAILLLDEPTTGVDRKARREIWELILRLHRQHNLTTLLVTHELDLVQNFCQRVVLMKNGRIFDQGRPAELFKEQKLEELYA